MFFCFSVSCVHISDQVSVSWVKQILRGEPHVCDFGRLIFMIFGYVGFCSANAQYSCVKFDFTD